MALTISLLLVPCHFSLINLRQLPLPTTPGMRMPVLQITCVSYAAVSFLGRSLLEWLHFLYLSRCRSHYRIDVYSQCRPILRHYCTYMMVARMCPLIYRYWRYQYPHHYGFRTPAGKSYRTEYSDTMAVHFRRRWIHLLNQQNPLNHHDCFL